MCFSQHMSQVPLGRCWQTTSRESFYASGVVWTSANSYCPRFPSANPTKWDQLLSLGGEGLHQDVHSEIMLTFGFLFSLNIWVLQDAFLTNRKLSWVQGHVHWQCILNQRPSALQSWTTAGRMKLFKTKLFCGKPLAASLCSLLQGDAGRLCRQAGSWSSRRHSYVWGHGARSSFRLGTKPHYDGTLQKIAVILLPPSAFSPKHLLCLCWGAETLLIFSFSAPGFSTTHKHMVQFYPITLHPWLVCF